MDDFGLRPEPPQWALAAGLPRPTEDESFTDYVTRLGLDAEELFVGLTEQTSPLANGRLAQTIRMTMPEAWDRFVGSLDIPLARRQELENIARHVFGESFRRRLRPAT